MIAALRPDRSTIFPPCASTGCRSGLGHRCSARAARTAEIRHGESEGAIAAVRKEAGWRSSKEKGADQFEGTFAGFPFIPSLTFLMGRCIMHFG
jgi:hypothetical protein